MCVRGEIELSTAVPALFVTVPPFFTQLEGLICTAASVVLTSLSHFFIHVGLTNTAGYQGWEVSTNIVLNVLYF